MRSKFTTQQKFDMVMDCRSSGLSDYMWCKKHDIQTSTFYSWVRQLKRNGVNVPERTYVQDHPREFLKDFKGICVIDGYQVYNSIEKEHDDLIIAGCWAHARRRFDEVLKATPKDKQKSCTANKALKMIQAIYRETNY